MESRFRSYLFLLQSLEWRRVWNRNGPVGSVSSLRNANDIWAFACATIKLQQFLDRPPPYPPDPDPLIRGAALHSAPIWKPIQRKSLKINQVFDFLNLSQLSSQTFQDRKKFGHFLNLPFLQMQKAKSSLRPSRDLSKKKLCLSRPLQASPPPIPIIRSGSSGHVFAAVPLILSMIKIHTHTNLQLCICHNCKMYLSKLQNTFPKMAKCIWQEDDEDTQTPQSPVISNSSTDSFQSPKVRRSTRQLK